MIPTMHLAELPESITVQKAGKTLIFSLSSLTLWLFPAQLQLLKRFNSFFYLFHVGRVSLRENLHRGHLWSSVQTAVWKLLTQLSGGK